MKYLVHYEGAGEGCDYTIGCNHAVSFVEAEDLQSAIDKIADGFLAYPDGDDSYYDPDDLDKVTIYAVSQEVSLVLEMIRCTRKERKDAKKRKKRDQKDRALYEELRVRFEK